MVPEMFPVLMLDAEKQAADAIYNARFPGALTYDGGKALPFFVQNDDRT